MSSINDDTNISRVPYRGKDIYEVLFFYALVIHYYKEFKKEKTKNENLS